jgi:hypothetical protein
LDHCLAEAIDAKGRTKAEHVNEFKDIAKYL